MIWGILALLGPPLWLCELGIAKGVTPSRRSAGGSGPDDRRRRSASRRRCRALEGPAGTVRISADEGIVMGTEARTFSPDWMAGRPC
jgi:hypothetical protein